MRREVNASADEPGHRLRHPVPAGPEFPLDQRQICGDERHGRRVGGQGLLETKMTGRFPEITLFQQPQPIVETVVVIGSRGEAGYRVHYQINAQIRREPIERCGAF